MTSSSLQPAGFCPACGSALAAPPETFQRCPFCHAALGGAIPAPEGRKVALAPSPAPRNQAARGRLPVLVKVLATLGCVVGVAVGVAALMPSRRHRSELPIAGLSAAPLNGWTAIDAPGMVGSLWSFDALANLSWARGIARAWKDDAALFRLDVDRVASDGTVAIMGLSDARAEYRFFSLACVAAHDRSASSSDPRCELDVIVQTRDPQGLVQALAPYGADENQHSLEDPACSLASAFAALRSAKVLPAHTVYDASLYGVKNDGEQAPPTPRWTLHAGGEDHEELAPVNATTCAVAGHEEPPALAPLDPAPAPAPGAYGLVDGSFAVTWPGRIVSAEGKAPGAGATCTLAVTATASDGDASEDQTTLVCAGKTLYDSKVQTMGMYSSDFDLMEAPVIGRAFAFRYELQAQSLGTREAPASQIVVDTRKRSVDAFREGADSFRVHVAVDAESAVRSGKPVLPSNVPAFDEVFTRTALITATSGSVPFSARACQLRISPAKASGMNCRVQLECGGHLAYGAGTSGYNECVVKDRKVQSFADPVPSWKDGDPALTCDVDAATATLSDSPAKGAPYSVSFALR